MPWRAMFDQTEYWVSQGWNLFVPGLENVGLKESGVKKLGKRQVPQRRSPWRHRTLMQKRIEGCRLDLSTPDSVRTGEQKR